MPMVYCYTVNCTEKIWVQDKNDIAFCKKCEQDRRWKR